MRSIGRYVPPAAFFASAALLAIDIKLSPIFAYRIQQPDFFVYYLAAQVGRTRGWAAMYDPSVFQPAVTAVVGRYLPYLNPPLLAWFVTPLSWLPYSLAAWLWTAILATALAATWLVAAPGALPRRIIHLLAAAAALPVFTSFLFGEVSLVIVLAVALSFVLLDRGHPWLAGLGLAAIGLKPQVAFLVPIALLVAGYWRVFVSWLAATLGLVVLWLVAIGTHGLHDIQRSLSLRAGVPGPIQVSLWHQVPYPLLNAVIMVLAVALFLFAASRGRRRGAAMPIAAGLVASTLLSPYLNFYDLSGLVLAAWLVLRTEPPAWQRILLAGFYAPLYLAPVWPFLTVACEFAWLISLAVLATLRAREAGAGPRELRLVS